MILLKEIVVFHPLPNSVHGMSSDAGVQATEKES
jgi:hypothetical protein